VGLFFVFRISSALLQLSFILAGSNQRFVTNLKEPSVRVLLVEDDLPLAEALASYLRSKHFTVDHVSSLREARAAVPVAAWDAVLLDLNLPDGDGLSLIGKVRQHSRETAILLLTARDQVSDRIRGLDAGADDYLVKPFDPDELMARLRAVERRRNGAPGTITTLGQLTIDLQRTTVHCAGQAVELTGKEWAVLKAMAARPDRIHSREALINALYGFDDETASNTVEVYISNLRRKLGRNSIMTLRGMGYRLTGAGNP
jgi:two-component system OmpR family response regulator